MENKINVANLLKDCPSGMELDCPMFENLEFDRIKEDDGVYNIICKVKAEFGDYNIHTFTKYGHYSTEKYSKCVIFPKGKTTWKGFNRPFKDGDIVATRSGLQVFILQRMKSNTRGYCYMGYDFKFNEFFNADVWSFERLASEEEKKKLFNAIKANGYKWNEETKTLEKLPKFKVGNRIKYINGKNKDGVEQGVILSLTNDTYDVAVTNDMGIFIPISEQDDWELVPNKFDITTLKPFDKVLVRDSDETWCINLFGCYNKTDNQYNCIGNTDIGWDECIPYEGNEHLLGTANDCDEYYKTWE